MIGFIKRLQNEIDWEGVALFFILISVPVSCGIDKCYGEMTCYDEVVSIKDRCSHGAKGTITKLADREALLCSCAK